MNVVERLKMKFFFRRRKFLFKMKFEGGVGFMGVLGVKVWI